MLYVYYKVAHGEEIAKTTMEGEISADYVSLVVNKKDDEVSVELAKDKASGGFSYMICLLIIFWVILLFCMQINILGN